MMIFTEAEIKVMSLNVANEMLFKATKALDDGDYIAKNKQKLLQQISRLNTQVDNQELSTQIDF